MTAGVDYTYTCTSVDDNGAVLCREGELSGGRLPAKEVLVEPLLAVFERLSVDDVHEPHEQVCVLQQEVKVGKYQ